MGSADLACTFSRLRRCNTSPKTSLSSWICFLLASLPSSISRRSRSRSPRRGSTEAAGVSSFGISWPRRSPSSPSLASSRASEPWSCQLGAPVGVLGGRFLGAGHFRRRRCSRRRDSRLDLLKAVSPSCILLGEEGFKKANESVVWHPQERSYGQQHRQRGGQCARHERRQPPATAWPRLGRERGNRGRPAARRLPERTRTEQGGTNLDRTSVSQRLASLPGSSSSSLTRSTASSCLPARYPTMVSSFVFIGSTNPQEGARGRSPTCRPTARQGPSGRSRSRSGGAGSPATIGPA